MRRLCYIVPVALSVVVGYLIWGLAAPALAGLIPSGEWQGFIQVVVYLGVGALGGVGIPILVLVLGIKVIVEAAE